MTIAFFLFCYFILTITLSVNHIADIMFILQIVCLCFVIHLNVWQPYS